MHVRWMLSKRVWMLLELMDLTLWAMRAVTHQQTEKKHKIHIAACQMDVIEASLDAPSEFMDLILWAMSEVTHQQIATVIKMVSKVGAFFHLCFVCCCPESK